ncbi:hypothetical protein HYC85_007430 [Camellia sinensis]|uniref:PAZ domain-containing protein n=1 Tax=Camellia sinensis TaxID=4442 RepID=A0A7J7HRD2_CAMSI|nr:hypothetical protein HYC85_007430 [Camellia sinensis]
MSARAFYEPILVTDFVAKYFNVKDLTRPLSDQDCLKVKRALRGIKVELAHKKHVQCRRISSLSVRPTNQLTFPLDDTGEKMSVVEYFRQKYNIILEYTFLPALLAGSDAKPVNLPMEVSALLKATCQRPDVREGSIKQMVRHNNYNNDKLVNEEFGIQVRAELASVDARVLPPPRLKYHDTGKETQVDPRVGVWNMIDKKMVNGGKVEFWTCISFSRSRINLDQFCRELISMCRSKGMDFNEPFLPIKSAYPGQIEKDLHDIHVRSTEKLANMGLTGKQLQLLIIVLPDVSGSYERSKECVKQSWALSHNAVNLGKHKRIIINSI